MRILLTGASGFIGRHAAQALAAAGHEVIGTGRGLGAGSAPSWHVCDLLAHGPAEALVAELRPQMLVHLAWTTQHGQFWTDPENETWVARSLALVRAALGAGVQRVCMAGTCFEYAFSPEPCDEARTPLLPHTPYDAAKTACHLRAAELTRAAGVSFAWARLFHLYGPREHPQRLVAALSRALAAGEPARMSSGQVWRDFMDARDAGAAIAALALSQVEGPVNVATGEPVQILTIGRMLAELAGRPDLLQVGALPDRENEPPRILALTRRLKEEVGFRPARSLRQGLGDALAAWRDATPRP